MRNYPLGLFGRPLGSNELGPLFENFVYNILGEKFRYSGATLHYWRTKDKAEVDFVVNLGKELLPIEVKYKAMKQAELTRSLRNFIEKYNPKRALVVNLSLEKTIAIKETEVMLLPFWKLFHQAEI